VNVGRASAGALFIFCALLMLAPISSQIERKMLNFLSRVAIAYISVVLKLMFKNMTRA